MRAVFGNWGRVFAANFFANLYVLLGFIALIIPGIILQVRYALLDPAVVLERSTDPRARSSQLTAGRRWPIFWSYCLYLAFFLPLSFGVPYVFDLLEIQRGPWLDAVVESILDIVGTVGLIVMFLFYCEAREAEELKEHERPEDGPIEGSRLPDFLQK